MTKSKRRWRANESTLSVFEVNGAGSRQITIKEYRGTVYSEDSDEVGVALVVENGEEADRTTQTVITTLRRNHLCDEEVMILPVERLYRVRVGRCE